MLPSLQKKPRPRRSHRHIPEGFQFLLEGNPHPLLIPSLIDEVASYLSVPDLKSFRGVCTQWYEEAWKHLRRKTKFILEGEDSLKLHTKFYSTTPRVHTNFELKGDLELGSSAVQEFFCAFGSKIKCICFNRVKWKETELRDLLFEKLPNLEELRLETRTNSDCGMFLTESDCSYEPNEHSVRSPAMILPKIRVLRLNILSSIAEGTTCFLRDILRISPNVEVISAIKPCSNSALPMNFILYICQAGNYDLADDLVHMPSVAEIAIAQAIIDSKELKLSKLSCLNFNVRLRTHGIHQLTLRGFPLRQLDLTVLSDVTSSTLHKLLSSVQDSLQVLKLKFQPGCSAAAEFTTPELTQLSSLTLNGLKGSLKFLEQTPNLKELTFIRINLQRALAMEAVHSRRPLPIESFRVREEYSVEGLAGVTIRLLAVLLPQVRKLKLENLCDDSMMEVFNEFPALEEFDALDGLYTDSGITGIKESVLASSQNSMDARELWRFKEKPEISCLKHIRSLSLGSPKISDLSILYGVLLCKSLRHLQLLSYQITDLSLIKLCSELDLYYLKTDYCLQITEDAINQVRGIMAGGRILSINEGVDKARSTKVNVKQMPKFMRRNGNASVRLNKMDVISPQPSSSSSLIKALLPPQVNYSDETGGGIVSAS